MKKDNDYVQELKYRLHNLEKLYSQSRDRKLLKTMVALEIEIQDIEENT